MRFPIVILLTLALSSLFSDSLLSEEAGLEVFTLSNGVPVIFQKESSSPLVAIDLWVKGGSCLPDLAPGSVHFLEHLLFKKKTPSGRSLDEEAETLGGVLEAYTSRDWMHFTLALPKDKFSQGLPLLAKVLSPPSFSEEDLSRERGVVLDEIVSQRLAPAKRLKDLLWEKVYGSHPYSRRIPGSVEQVLRLGPADLQKAYQYLFRPENLRIVIVGNLPSDQVKKSVQQTFGSLFSNLKEKQPLPRLSTIPSRVSWPSNRDLGLIPLAGTGGKGVLLLAFPGPTIDQIQEVWTLDLLSVLLDEGPLGLLSDLLVKSGLAKEVEVDFLTQIGPSLFVIQVTTQPQQIPRVREVLQEEINNLLKRVQSSDLLQSAKQRLLTHYAFDTETVMGKASFLGFYAVVSSLDRARSYKESILKISGEEVRRVIEKYLKAEKGYWLVGVPATPSSPESGRAYEEGRKGS